MPRAVPHEKLSKFLTQRIGQTQEGKRFFFVKKNQKPLRGRGLVRDSRAKSFCFFFQKEALPCLATR
jgi:hypothetical protein